MKLYVGKAPYRNHLIKLLEKQDPSYTVIGSGELRSQIIENGIPEKLTVFNFTDMETVFENAAELYNEYLLPQMVNLEKYHKELDTQILNHLDKIKSIKSELEQIDSQKKDVLNELNSETEAVNGVIEIRVPEDPSSEGSMSLKGLESKSIDNLKLISEIEVEIKKLRKLMKTVEVNDPRNLIIPYFDMKDEDLISDPEVWDNHSDLLVKSLELSPEDEIDLETLIRFKKSKFEIEVLEAVVDDWETGELTEYEFEGVNSNLKYSGDSITNGSLLFILSQFEQWKTNRNPESKAFIIRPVVKVEDMVTIQVLNDRSMYKVESNTEEILDYIWTEVKITRYKSKVLQSLVDDLDLKNYLIYILDDKILNITPGITPGIDYKLLIKANGN